jgi:hypothetical protein
MYHLRRREGYPHSRAPPLKLSVAMTITLPLILILGTINAVSQTANEARVFLFSCCGGAHRVSARCLHATGIETFSSSNLTLTKYMSLAILVWT